MILLKKKKRNNYYFARNGNQKIFLKEYLPETASTFNAVAKEYKKSKILFKTLELDGVCFIRPLFYFKNFIAYEWIEKIDIFCEHLNRKDILRKAFLLGRSLRLIHNTPLSRRFNNVFCDSGRLVFLHGDFTVRNIFLSDDKIIISDASISQVANKNTVYISGNIYRDISLFSATLKLACSFSIKKLIKYKYKEKKIITEFINGYFYNSAHLKYDIQRHLHYENEYFYKLLSLNKGKNQFTRLIKRVIYMIEILKNNMMMKND